MDERTLRDTDSMQNQLYANDKKACITDSPEIEDADWYHGYMPREEIKRLLNCEGDFAVRQTELNKGKGFQLVISVRSAERVNHFPIFMTAEDSKLYLKRRKTFTTVTEMVHVYMTTKEEVNERTRAVLKKPISRQTWELQREKIIRGTLMGHGQFGAVYKGILINKNGSQEVAIKLLKKDGLNKTMIKDFAREARLLRDLKHPNIVQFLGVSYEQDPIMLCMELADGGSLDKHLKKQNLPVAIKLRMCIDAAQGLAYIHSKKCIHRDVSARNCLVSQGRVKISDFGLAYVITTHSTENKLDLGKMPIRWLAPEAMDGQYSAMSDVYSFGILMWEIFTNAMLPFEGKSLAQVYDEVRNKHLRLTRPNEMPEEVGQFMTIGCFGTPNSRWSMDKIRSTLTLLFKRMFGKKSKKNNKCSAKSVSEHKVARQTKSTYRF